MTSSGDLHDDRLEHIGPRRVDSGRLQQLDGLRGVAALVVVVAHSAEFGFAPPVLGGGFGQLGVALFYALSGFLMGHLYFGRDASSAEIYRYAVNRAARVLPLFYVTLILAGGLFVLTGYSVYYVNSLERFVLNAALVHGTSVFWSIPVEVQFYVAFAVLWWLHARRGWSLRRVLALGLATQAAAAILIVGLKMLIAPDLGSASLPFWGHLFLCGLAMSRVRLPRLPMRAGGMATAVLGALIVLALVALQHAPGLPEFPNFANPLINGVPLIALYLAVQCSPALRFLDTRVLRWLGGVSYGVYLFHIPVLELTSSLGVSHVLPGVGFAMVLGLTLLTAWLARHGFEVPVQRLLRARLTPASLRRDSGGNREIPATEPGSAAVPS